MNKIIRNLLPALGFATISTVSAQTTLGLEAFYRFEGNVKDSSGKGHHGILQGATLTTDRFGNANSAYYFDNGDNINVPSFSSVGFSGVTISVWVQTSKLTPQQQVVQGAVGVLYINWLQTGHFMGAFDGTGNNNSSSDISSTYVADNSWHQITATNDGSLTRVYVDGQLEVSYSETLSTGSSDLQIGGGGWYFTGKMDDIRIYSRTLTDAEVKGLYHPALGFNNGNQSLLPVKLYPNPIINGTICQLELPAHQSKVSVTITSMTGQQLYRKEAEDNTTQISLDIQSLPAGV